MRGIDVIAARAGLDLSDRQTLRLYNKERVRGVMEKNPRMTIGDISIATGLCRRTVSAHMGNILDEWESWRP